MNLKHLNLDLYGVPEDAGIQIPVYLIAQDLKSRKLTNTLTNIGCDGCFCISELCELVLAFTGFDERPDNLYEYYFDLLDQYCERISHDNDMPVKEAVAIYNRLKNRRAKTYELGYDPLTAG